MTGQTEMDAAPVATALLLGSAIEVARGTGQLKHGLHLANMLGGQGMSSGDRHSLFVALVDTIADLLAGLTDRDEANERSLVILHTLLFGEPEGGDRGSDAEVTILTLAATS